MISDYHIEKLWFWTVLQAPEELAAHLWRLFWSKQLLSKKYFLRVFYRGRVDFCGGRRWDPPQLRCSQQALDTHPSGSPAPVGFVHHKKPTKNKTNETFWNDPRACQIWEANSFGAWRTIVMKSEASFDRFWSASGLDPGDGSLPGPGLKSGDLLSARDFVSGIFGRIGLLAQREDIGWAGFSLWFI